MGFSGLPTDFSISADFRLTLAAGAVSTGLQYQADMAATFEAVRWSLGHLGQLGFEGGLDLSDHLGRGDHRFPLEVSALLGEALVFELDRPPARPAHYFFRKIFKTS